MRQDAGAQAAARASARHAQGLGHGRDCDWPGAEGRVETFLVREAIQQRSGLRWDGSMGWDDGTAAAAAAAAMRFVALP